MDVLGANVHRETGPEKVEPFQTSRGITVGKGENKPGQRRVELGVIVREQGALGHER